MPPISSADELEQKSGEIEYGTISSGSSVSFFKVGSPAVLFPMG